MTLNSLEMLADSTAITLGMIRLQEVYDFGSETGQIEGLRESSSRFIPIVPKCPHCQRPIRQYATQRYNRLINRAVLEEMSRRFIVTGQVEIREIEERLTDLENELENTRSSVTKSDDNPVSADGQDSAVKELEGKLRSRYSTTAQIQFAIAKLHQGVAARHQPVHKLHEATAHAINRNTSLENALSTLELQDAPLSGHCDHRVTLGTKLLEIKAGCITLEDKYLVFSAARAKYGDSSDSLRFPGGSLVTLSTAFLDFIAGFISECREKALPKLNVEASLYHVRVARLFRMCGPYDPTIRETAARYENDAMKLLEGAANLCEQGFRDADKLLQAVNDSFKLFQRESYEEVTAEELEAIKKAMVSGPSGMATHSGHWYNCINGHPVRHAVCSFVLIF